jgi:hypothetical protein
LLTRLGMTLNNLNKGNINMYIIPYFGTLVKHQKPISAENSKHGWGHYYTRECGYGINERVSQNTFNSLFHSIFHAGILLNKPIGNCPIYSIGHYDYTEEFAVLTALFSSAEIFGLSFSMRNN